MQHRVRLVITSIWLVPTVLAAMHDLVLRRRYRRATTAAVHATITRGVTFATPALEAPHERETKALSLLQQMLHWDLS